MTPPDRRAEDAFDDLFTRYAAPIRSYARRRIGDAAADDVVTETFLIAWRKLDRMPEPPLPWLLGIARRVSSNQQRAAARRNRLSERIAFHEPPPGSGERDGKRQRRLERTGRPAGARPRTGS